jgi:hypothetical protein
VALSARDRVSRSGVRHCNTQNLHSKSLRFNVRMNCTRNILALILESPHFGIAAKPRCIPTQILVSSPLNPQSAPSYRHPRLPSGGGGGGYMSSIPALTGQRPSSGKKADSLLVGNFTPLRKKKEVCYQEDFQDIDIPVGLPRGSISTFLKRGPSLLRSQLLYFHPSHQMSQSPSPNRATFS